MNRETNLMSLINLSLEIVYCSHLESNYDIIRFIRFVSRFTDKLCDVFFILSRFKSPCRYQKKIGILNYATKQRLRQKQRGHRLFHPQPL